MFAVGDFGFGRAEAEYERKLFNPHQFCDYEYTAACEDCDFREDCDIYREKEEDDE